jgi:hypothetical protein
MMTAAAMLESSECYKMGNYQPLSMKIGTPTKRCMRVQKSQKGRRRSIFKMAVAAMLKIQVHAVKWAITTRF